MKGGKINFLTGKGNKIGSINEVFWIEWSSEISKFITQGGNGERSFVRTAITGTFVMVKLTDALTKIIGYFY